MLEAALKPAHCRRVNGADDRTDADPGGAYLKPRAAPAAGVVISASHNPFEDNGIKFFSPRREAADSVERRSRRGWTSDRDVERASWARPRIEDAAARYIEFCKSTFPNNLDLRGCASWSTAPTRHLPHCAARLHELAPR